jgi:3-deoxy-D-manno-octulosonic acid kinase
MRALLNFDGKSAALRRRNLGRAMIEAQVQSTMSGAILFDAQRFTRAEESWFEPAHWRVGDGSAQRAAGRGTVTYFEAPFGACVLRHYRRGGLVAHINADSYLWTGRSRTRGFREFHLLARLHDAGLRVPAPVLARYVRNGMHYRADLVTQLIPGARTLAERLVASDLDAVLAACVGRTLAGFHAHGAWHADLNAHNLLTDGSGEVWLLDFDRGRIRKPAMAWQQANLERLQRSFLKLGARRKLPDFDVVFWHPLLAAYHRALAERHVRGESA